MASWPYCGAPPPWWYEQFAAAPPARRPKRDREDLEDYLAYLEEELKRVREDLEETKAAVK
jgi:hypothetical protein